MNLNPIPTAVFAIVMLCWLVFAAFFFFRKHPPQALERKRERSFVVGIVLQAVGYATVWSFQRPSYSAIAEMNVITEYLLAAFTVGIAVGSVWLVMSAVRTLGKQWSVAARLVEGHSLIVLGPYKLVRHPIYTGMFGMLLATGLAISHWAALPPAVIIFWLGTTLRTRSEDKLLREEFGEAYEKYAREVPAVIPRISSRSTGGRV
jgi:protein-S-isoprenylcysteine O-methyltransferase Ste14